MKDKIVIRSSFKDVAAFTAVPSYRSGVINEAPSEIKHINYAVNSNAAFLHPAARYSSSSGSHTNLPWELLAVSSSRTI